MRSKYLFKTISLLFPAFVVLGVFFNSLWWSSVIKYDGAPDEYTHLAVPRFYVDFHRLPVQLKDPGMGIIYRANGRDFSLPYALFANYGYFVNAITGIIVPQFLMPDFYQRARVGSALMASLFILVVYKLLKVIFPKDVLTRNAILFVAAFVPQFTFLSAYVNSDIAGVLASGVTYWFCYRLVCAEELSKRAFVLGGVGLGMILLSRVNMLLLLLLFPWCFFVRHVKFRITFSRVFAEGLVVLALGILAGGWWYVRNLSVYGDITGYKTFYDAVKQYSYPYVPRNFGFGLMTMFFGKFNGLNWILTSAESFFGTFGYMTIYYPLIFYVIFFTLVILAIVGIIKVILRTGLKRIFMEDLGGTLYWLGVGIVGLVNILIMAIFSWSVVFQPQGRYLYASYFPFTVGLVYGLTNLIKGRFWKACSVALISIFIVVANIWGRQMIFSAGGGL